MYNQDPRGPATGQLPLPISIAQGIFDAGRNFVFEVS